MSKETLAAHYASLDWPVFPVIKGSKKPATTRGFLDATTDRAQIAAWWRESPEANVGISTGPAGLLVIDFDSKLDPRGTLAIGERPLPLSLRVGTPSGGVHAYFRSGGPGRVPSSVERLAPKVDVRSSGGYVLAAGSRTEQGVYVPVAGPILAAPAWLIEACQKPEVPPAERMPVPVDSARFTRYSEAALRAECEDVAGFSEGGRNHRLNRAAFVLGQLVAGGGLDEISTIDALTKAGLACGLPEKEVQQTITSGLKSGALNPRGASE